MKVTIKGDDGTTLSFNVKKEDLPDRLRERLYSWLRGEVRRQMNNIKDVVKND